MEEVMGINKIEVMGWAGSAMFLLGIITLGIFSIIGIICGISNKEGRTVEIAGAYFIITGTVLICLGGLFTSIACSAANKLEKADVQELFLMSEGKGVVNVEIIDTDKIEMVGTHYLSVVYTVNGKEVTYTNPKFTGNIQTETSVDNNYHIGTKEQRSQNDGEVTIFIPSDTQKDSYVSN